MLHILDYEDKIIDFISEDDASIINAKHNRDINNRSETFDFTILSERAINMQKNYRVIIQDSTGQYREFIIEHISQDMDGYTEIETTASYLEDITGGPPYAPGSFEKKTTTEALYDVLKDTGWQVSEATEYGGIRTTSWTGFHTRYDILVQLCTTYDMIVDFYIELGSNTVDGRYVVLRKRNPIFQGKEIVKGKDLTGLKRIVDMSEVNTALLCVGPEKEDGSRITLTVKDDEAQAQFGLPGRYIWGIYEPETEDENMTEARLRSLGTTELNKRKKEKISYEVTSLDIKTYQPHEIVHIGDMVRIKDRDFTPPLYLEAEVIAEDYDMVTKESTYSFGEYKEYREDNLRQEFYKQLSNIRQRMNDNFSNVNTIVRETNSQLQYFEKKIIKSQDAPENPVNDMLWLDTSNPKVAVLRRYWNGQWINATAEKADDIDAVTREKALYDDLNNTFINLNIQHSKLLREVYEVIDSEYLVDTALKQQVQQNLDNTINVYHAIETNLESMTPETATIGKLVDTQALFLKYRELLQTLYNSLENAKIAIDDRFKLLQSQYTDEKFNDAMSKVAEGIGGTWNAETGQLLADIPSQQELEDALKTYINSQDDALKQLIDGEVNSKITQTKNELSSNISAVSAKVNGIQVGGRNLFLDTETFGPKFTGSVLNYPLSLINGKYWITLGYIWNFYVTMDVEIGKPHTLSFNAKSRNDVETIAYTPIRSTKSDGTTEWLGYYKNPVTKEKRVKLTFTPVTSKIDIFFLKDGSTLPDVMYSEIKLEKGTIATDYTQAPEDIQANIEKAQADATTASKAYADAQDALRKTEAQAYADGVVTEEEERAIADAQEKLEQAKVYADTTKAAALAYTDEKLEPITSTQTKQSTDIKQLQDGITLKADKTEITTMYDNNIKPLETKVNDNTAQLKVQADQISSKVANSTYTADVNNIITRLNSADTQRTQLSNAINDRVTIKEYTDNKTATTNQINTAVNNVQVGGRNLLENSANIKKAINDTSNNYNQYWATLITSAHSKLQLGETITISFDVQMERGEILRVYDTLTNYDFMFGEKVFTNLGNKKQRLSFTLPLVSTTKSSTVWNLSFYNNNNGDRFTIENIKIEKGNKATDWTPAPEDVKADIDKTKAETDKTLSVMQTQINQNGTDINARATKEEFNASKKTLSNVISDLSINTTTGLTLSYDENGNIQSHTVGPDGIMLKGDRVNINVNKDFQVLAGNVNNKVGKDEIINRLNLSPEGLDINVNNLGIRGGDTTNYLSIKNQEILSRGTFTRTWGGVTDTPSAEIGIKDGYILSRNKKTGYNLYMTEKGLSTMMSGGVGSEQAGALEFHYDLFNDNSRGVRLSSTYGVVFLHSENSRIYTRSRYTTNIETWEASVYIRPQVYSRPGTNEFSFYLKDNDNAKDTDGTLLFGEIYDDKGQAGSGIRFKKAGFSGQTEGDYEPVVYATDKFGNIGTGSFHARNFYGDFQSRSGYLYLKADDRVRITDYKGYNNGNPTYGDLQCRWIQSESIRTTSTNFYIGTSTGEVRITNNLLYNGGDIGYKDIRFKNYVAMSSERYKYDIKEWNYSVLDAYRNDLKLYSYKNKSEKEEEYVRDHHGIIIEREIPIEWRHRDGFDGNEVLFWNTKAIQELIEKVDELEEQINESK
ncbi:phage tail spike protein [Staphylococcus simulans]|uniref:phage tail spike protein n=1 Tax=Staphylococcus simulans TaxID=1286 RepID=UPI001BCE05FD|nr:phage tail spike protein [Staphylococcus simulans]